MNRKILSQVAVCALLGASTCYLTRSAAAATASTKDSRFLAMAAQADMTAAHMGAMAEDRGADGGVKDFGKMLVQDHTEDYQQLTILSSKTGNAIPKAIDRENNRQITYLDRYKGRTFDREFLTHQTAEHQRLIKMFREEAEHGKNAEIKAYAQKALPAMERHLHEAQDLVKKAS